MNLIVSALAERSGLFASPSAPAAPARASAILHAARLLLLTLERGQALDAATLPLLPEPEQSAGRRGRRFESSHSDQIPSRFGWGTPGAASPDRPPAVAPGASAR